MSEPVYKWSEKTYLYRKNPDGWLDNLGFMFIFCVCDSLSQFIGDWSFLLFIVLFVVCIHRYFSDKSAVEEIEPNYITIRLTLGGW